MCNGNVTVSTRKRVLEAIHTAAVNKAKYGSCCRTVVDSLVGQWIDELAEKHNPCKCSKCGFGFQ